MKISVITASFNSARTIGDTLRSVSAQTHSDVEQIVIDGGSTDETLAIVRAEGHRVTALVSEPDKGIYDAMNKGLRLAQGDVIGLLNSDDFLASPRVLATVADAFTNPSIGAVYGDLCYVRQFDTEKVVRYWRSSNFEPGSFARGWAPPHPTLYVRRDVYDHLGGFDLTYSLATDVEFMVRLLEVQKVCSVHIPDVLVRMRLGGATNKSLRNVIKQNTEVWSALRRHGLARTLNSYAIGKLISRGRQFLTRPPAR